MGMTRQEEYEKFLVSKVNRAKPVGFKPDAGDLNKNLFHFQRVIVPWACECGRSAVFAGTGLGKTIIQLNWAELVTRKTNKPILSLAPLAVNAQTIREAVRFGFSAGLIQSDKWNRIINYEQIHNLPPSSTWGGIVLDESSILKHQDSKTRKMITDYAQGIHYRLACSATPSPNAWTELGNHAEFLGVATMQEMLARFFRHDGGETSKWTLKGHAVKEFWAWVASWAVMVRMPSDLGFSDDGFVLPPLIHHQHTVSSGPLGDMDTLFKVEAKTLNERRGARKRSMDERVERAIHLACSNDEQWLIWCDLNAESKALSDGIKGAIEVTGSDLTSKKEQVAMDFPDEKIRVVVSKPSIYGAGLNFQSCHNIAFVGMSDSFEQIFQAIRRCWRFGQKHPVNAHFINGFAEGAVVENYKRKERQDSEMASELIGHVRAYGLNAEMSKRQLITYTSNKEAEVPSWL